MGQEISSNRFRRQDFEQFTSRLEDETKLLEEWFATDRFSARVRVAGFELEVWIVDAAGRPAPVNEAYLEALHSPLVVPELSRYNVEINAEQQPLQGAVLGTLHQELEAIWERCTRTAARFGSALAMVGILPSLREEDLNLACMSPLRRYRALNEQLLRLRQGQPVQLQIRGNELLRTQHMDVMLEAATTSFQLHLQAPPAHAVRLFNASVIASAALVAVSANSPYLFGRDLWQETRIPVFEQAVAVGPEGKPRVTFGDGYVEQSLLELFQQNLREYPVLLPHCEELAPERMCHVRLHNGTVWRWNRPLIGYDRDGTPHLRIEHRVIPAGPTIVDAIANAAFYYGVVQALADARTPPEGRLPFATAKENFYAAARLGLNGNVRWLDGVETGLRALVLEHLLPEARRGLAQLEVESEHIDHYLGIIEARARTGRTGSQWQRDFVARFGPDMEAMTLAYLERQQKGIPVHEWGLLC